jgi:hypothetical protein
LTPANAGEAAVLRRRDPASSTLWAVGGSEPASVHPSTPYTLPQPSSLLWSELLRKYRKHNPDRQGKRLSRRIVDGPQATTVLAATFDLDYHLHAARSLEAREQQWDADRAHEYDVGLASFPSADGKGITPLPTHPLLTGQREAPVLAAITALEGTMAHGEATREDGLAARLVLAFAKWSLASTHDQAVPVSETYTLEGASGYLDDLILRNFVLHGQLCVQSVAPKD